MCCFKFHIVFRCFPHKWQVPRLIQSAPKNIQAGNELQGFKNAIVQHSWSLNTFMPCSQATQFSPTGYKSYSINLSLLLYVFTQLSTFPLLNRELPNIDMVLFLKMAFQISSLVCPIVAQMTTKRFLSCVDSHVLLQIPQGLQIFPTKGAQSSVQATSTYKHIAFI